MALFATLTNVDFDPERFKKLITKSVALRDELNQKVKQAGGSPRFSNDPVTYKLASSIDELVKDGKKVGLKSDKDMNPDLLSLHHTLLFGLKGLAAYAEHAMELGQEDNKVYQFVQEGLVAGLDKKLEMNDVLGLVLKCGEVNLRAMELLDAGNTTLYGHPVPTKVPLGVKKR